MKISIHQPNFFPWFPYFQKLMWADVFVLLENCQYEKNGFQNRFNKDEKWHTMSTKSGMEPIVQKKFIDYKKDWEKIKKNLKEYKFLNEFDDCFSDSLSVTNKNIIIKIAKILNIKTKIIVDCPTNLTGTDRLIEICKSNNATEYLSGISGKHYLDYEKFNNFKIKLLFQKEEEFIKTPIIDIIKHKF